jgi:two-component system, sensor histidine kinase and response regulator
MEEQSKGVILIIDDSPTNLRLLLMTLSKAGFKVISAEDGELGIKQAIQAKPDLILLDVLMYGIDGIETCQRLKAREDTKDIPVIFMTVLSEPLDRLQGFRVGAVDYITKPLYHEEVLARINAHLTIRRQQQQLQEQTEQLQALNDNKDKFFSILSQDLQVPFEGLLHYTEFIIAHVNGCSRDEIKEIVGTLHTSIENLYELLKNLFTWSSVQRGSLECHPKSFDLRELLERNLTLLRPTAEKKQILLKNFVRDSLLVYADASMIYIVMRNLITNALKFTNRGGKIKISAVENPDSVEITVVDTGSGIPVEDLPKLFHIGARYQRTGTEGEEGAGLGLILCKELVEKNQGTLAITSAPGNGTTVTMMLPTAPPAL